MGTGYAPGMSPLRAVLPRVLLASQACDRVEYQPVDLQLDLEGSFPLDADTLHLCVEGAGEHSQGAGRGQGVFNGIPVGPVVVHYGVLDEDGVVLASAGPVELSLEDSYVVAPLEQGGELCEDDGSVVQQGEDSLVLGFRVVEP